MYWYVVEPSVLYREVSFSQRVLYSEIIQYTNVLVYGRTKCPL